MRVDLGGFDRGVTEQVLDCADGRWRMLGLTVAQERTNRVGMSPLDLRRQRAARKHVVPLREGDRLGVAERGCRLSHSAS